MTETASDHLDRSYAFTADIAERIVESGRRIVITGARGWLGQATLEMLHVALGDALMRRVVCFGSAAGDIALFGTTLPLHPLKSLSDLMPEPTVMLHCAFLTKDRAERMDEETYLRVNQLIRECVLTSLDVIGADAIFVPSSGATYSADDNAASPAMRLYGSLKREDETVFSGWAEARGAACAVARIFNLSGPHINKYGNYALASFIVDALAGRPVEVRARRPVVRSYVAIRALMSIVFACLLDPKCRIERFDTAGTDVLDVRDLARRVADLIGSGCVNSAPLDTGMSADIYVGDASRYSALGKMWGVNPIPIDSQILETAAFIAATQPS